MKQEKEFEITITDLMAMANISSNLGIFTEGVEIRKKGRKRPIVLTYSDKIIVKSRCYE